MNITEASDVQKVLQYVLGQRSAVDQGLDDIELDQRAMASAARLAERAHKALGAGPRASEVEEAWLSAEFGPWRDEPQMRLVETAAVAGEVL